MTTIKLLFILGFSLVVIFIVHYLHIRVMNFRINKTVNAQMGHNKRVALKDYG